MPLPASVAASDQAVPLTCAAVQVAPLSSETWTCSPVCNAALKVPLMVCAAVSVMKSVADVP